MNPELKWRFVVALIVVFFAGVACGVMGAAHHAHHAFMARHRMQFGDRMREHLRRQLQLTPEQYSQVVPIIDATSKQLELIREETRTRVAQTMDESHEKIAPLLTPEQRTRLEQMRRHHEHMLRMRGGQPHLQDDQ